MLSYCKRRWLEIEDWLRYHPRVRRSICRYKLWRTPSPDAQTIVHLCAAARLADDVGLERRIQELIVERVRRLNTGQLNWAEFVADFRDPRIHKAAILTQHAAGKNGRGTPEITRFKGLGEMMPKVLWETTLNPRTRRLLRVEVTDQIVTDRVINELMGKDASARFRFIMERADEAEELDV